MRLFPLEIITKVATELTGRELKENTTIRNKQCGFQENKACQTNVKFIPEYTFFLFLEAEIILCRGKTETLKPCKVNWPLSTDKL